MIAKRKIEIKWGLIFVITSLLWAMIEKSFGFHDQHLDKHAVFTMFFMLPAVLIFFFALWDKKRSYYHGKMTFSQGFVSGLIITLVVALFSPLSQYLTTEVISPDFFGNTIAYVTKHNIMPAAEAEAHFNLQNYMLLSVVGAILSGILTSAIAALFMRSRH